MVRLKALLPVNSRCNQQYFNSSMVRLKVHLLHHLSIALMDFNSSMVRLKAEIVRYLSLFIHAFQFLYGAIKSFIAVCSISPTFYFNSSMVRLKDCSSSSILTAKAHFNSSMVRLKVQKLFLHRPAPAISIPLWCD